METLILAGDVNAGGVVMLPCARDEVLVKQVRLGRGGFMLTVVPVNDDTPEAERVAVLTAGACLRNTSP